MYCFVDKSNRIVASRKLDKFIGKTTPQLKAGDEVSIVVAEPTDLGFKVVVNNEHWGLLYKDQVFNNYAVVISAKPMSTNCVVTAKSICCWINRVMAKPWT